MPNYDTTISEMLKIFKRAIKYGDEINAYTGRKNDDGSWSTMDTVTGPSRIYVTIAATRQVIIVRNNLGLVAYNIPIFLDKDKRGDYRMVGIDMLRAESIFGSGLTSVIQPPVSGDLSKAVLPGTGFKDGRLRASAAGDLYVYLEPHVYVSATGEPAEFTGENIDVSSSLPGTSNQWWLLVAGVDLTDGSVVTETTTAKSVDLSLERAEALAVTYPGVGWRGAVKLRNAQTKVPTEAGDFIDLRAHFQDAPVLNNLSATAAPTVDDDVDVGYGPGSVWVDVSNGNVYICTDATDGAAVWIKVTQVFLDLTDTPSSFSGQGAKLTAVNSGESALEFIDPATVRIFERSTADVSTPPTDAELDSAFGTPATVGDGFVAFVDDNDADTAVYLVMSNGTSWWFTSMTKAT